MFDKRKIPLHALLEACALIASVGFIVMYVFVALKRLSYPFELEWMEGGMVDHVRRILDGFPIYVSPSLDFVPFGYPPLFYWTSAALARFMGIGFEPLRIVSFAASLCAMTFIILLVRRETGRFTYGILAAGVFAATYRITGGWFDVGRVDSLFLMLVLAAACLIRCRETYLSWIVAGLALAAAVFTKQVAIAPAVVLIIYGWWINRRLAAALSVAFVLTTISALVWTNSVSNGWFFYYAFAQPAAHKIIFGSGVYFICRSLCYGMGIALLMAVAGLALQKRSGDEKSFLFWTLFILGMCAAAALPLMKAGGWHNDLIPAYAVLAMMLAVSAHKLNVHFRQSPDAREALQLFRATAFVWTAVLIQLAGLLYTPSGRIPTAADEQAGKNFVARLAAYSGDVLVLSHGYLPALAGKRPHAHAIAITDVLSGGKAEISEALLTELRRAVLARRFAAIILDGADDMDFVSDHFKELYSLDQPMFDHPNVFWPVSGNPTRPDVVYVPK